MDDVASLYYQETINELKQKLCYTTQEMLKHKGNVNQLLQHLSIVYKERDEAQGQLKKLFYIFSSLNPQTGIVNPIQIQASKANSSITESNILSDTYNNQSQNDHFLDIVSSPDSSNLSYLNQQQHQKAPFVVDQGSLAIDTLVKGKILPPKGKLLQAVKEAGPLLKTLLLAGSLPKWRNPPPVQSFHIPLVSVSGCDSKIVKPSLNSNLFSSPELMPLTKGSCLGGIKTSDNGFLGKRQRLH